MNAISTNPIVADKIIKNKLKELSFNNIEIVDKDISIKDDSGEDLYTIKFDFDEFNFESSNIKYYGDSFLVFQDSIVFLLRDINAKIDQDIKLVGNLSGDLKKSCDSKALILLSIKKSSTEISIEDITFFDELLDNNIVQIEIRNISITKEEEISKIITSVISTISFQCNIILEEIDSLKLKDSLPVIKDEITTFKPFNIEPILYFNSAEKTSYLHIKYIEYYHVVEYYFLQGRIQEINKLIKNAVRIHIINNNGPLEEDYYNTINSINKVYEGKEFDGEFNQLKYVLKEFIGFDLIENIVTNIFESKIDFLKNKIFDIEKTVVDISIFKDPRKLSDKKASDIDTFFNTLTFRIYKIRNYLIHTKKGENSKVFTPTPELLTMLDNDIKLLRSISYTLLSESTT